MINLYFNNSGRGPGKVYSNLIKGLELLNIDYTINQNINNGWKNLILQSHWALNSEKINDAIIGPNICVLPIDNQEVMSQKYKKIIVPSEWVQKLYERWLPKEKIIVWPVGIDTDYFKDFSNEHKTNDCLIYFKRRDESELNLVISFLKSINQTYQIVKYGSYSESDFLNHLKSSKYGIVINKCESQGIAIQEMMSTNLPLLVWDTPIWDDRGETFKIEATSVPYWDRRCGYKFTKFEEIDDIFNTFIEKKNTYSPRHFILEHLSLEHSVNNLIKEFYGL
jgi:hypothetical protein